MLLFDTKTYYALNKPEHNTIVYRGTNGMMTRLSREQFSSEEEFWLRTSWADDDCHERGKENHVYGNHVFLVEVLFEEPISPKMEETLSQEESRLVEILRAKLSRKQFHPLWLFCVNRLTETEVSRVEGVTQQSVSETLNAAKEK